MEFHELLHQQKFPTILWYNSALDPCDLGESVNTEMAETILTTANVHNFC